MPGNDSDGDINSPETWKKMGNDHFKKDDFESAISCYKQAIEQNPKYIEAWNNLGLSYLKLGKIDDAKLCNNKVLALKSQQGAINSILSDNRSDEIPSDNTSTEITPEEIGRMPFELEENEKILKISEKCSYRDIDEGFLSVRTCLSYLTNQRLVIFKQPENVGFIIPLNSIEKMEPSDSFSGHKIELLYTPQWGSTKNIELTFLEPSSLNPFKIKTNPIRDEWLSSIEELRKQIPPIDWEKMEKGYELLASGDMSVIGSIPPEKVPIILKKNEICYVLISNGVEYLEERAVRDTSGGFTSIRVPIVKGISISTGRFGAESRSYDELKKIDIGNLIVTNKRVIFDGKRKNMIIPLNKIMSVTAFSDGIGIDREDRLKTIFFTGGFNGMAVKSVIQGAIKNLD